MLSPRLLLSGYSAGVFPMARSRNDPELEWVDPQLRGIFELDKFHISRSLHRAIRRKNYIIRTNSAFAQVIECCADRPVTWINTALFGLYQQLHQQGHAHSLEVFDTDGMLIGGVFGVTLDAAFFGESMFSRRTDASKIALAWLVAHLRNSGFTLFDTQFLTPHLASLGAIEISRADYRARLARALLRRADFRAPPLPDRQDVVQRNTQTS